MLDHVTYTSEEISAMNCNTIFRLVKSDPVTVACFLDCRFQQLLHQVVKSPHNPIHKVIDHFTRVEFANRGTIHVHWFTYLKDTPKYVDDSNEVIAEYFDQIISCSSDVPPEFICFLEHQLHRHMKFCRIGNHLSVSMSFPKPPMCKTMILEPIKFDSQELEDQYKSKWCKIEQYFMECGTAFENITTYEEMLSELDMIHDEYIKAVECSIVRPKLFLKC